VDEDYCFDVAGVSRGAPGRRGGGGPPRGVARRRQPPGEVTRRDAAPGYGVSSFPREFFPSPAPPPI